jgi:hypothetical protein
MVNNADTGKIAEFDAVSGTSPIKLSAGVVIGSTYHILILSGNKAGDNAPTLLASSYTKETLTVGNTRIAFMMTPAVVDAAFVEDSTAQEARQPGRLAKVVGLDAGKAYRLRYIIGNSDEGVVSYSSDTLKKATGNGLTPLINAEGGTTGGTFDFWGDLTLRSNSATFQSSTSGTFTLSDLYNVRTSSGSGNNTTTGEAEYHIANVGNVGTTGKADFKLEYVPFGKLDGAAWANSTDFHTGVSTAALPVWVIRNGLNDADGAISFVVVPAGGVAAQGAGIYEDNNPIPIPSAITGTSVNDLATALSAINVPASGYGSYTIKLGVTPELPEDGKIILGGVGTAPDLGYPNIKNEQVIIGGLEGKLITLPDVEELWTPNGNIVSYGQYTRGPVWLGGDWSLASEWGAWTEDAVDPAPWDPVDLSGYTEPANEITITETDGTTGVVTITFLNDADYRVTNAGTLSRDYSLAVDRITFASGFTRRIAVNGANTDGGVTTIRTPTVTLTLSGVTLDTDGGAQIALQNGANVTLVLAGANTLTSQLLYHAGLNVPADNAITIIGSGTLTATGNGNAAGIGGGHSQESGEITIGGNATVVATGGQYGAGLGGGGGGAGGKINIGGSAKVIATAASLGQYGGAGIGGGSAGNGGTISIGGSAIVTAPQSTIGGAGIGGGMEGGGGTITIGGSAKVTAAGSYGAGIGAGLNASGCDITIQDHAMVIASGGSSAGIGGGYTASAGTALITIKGGALVYARNGVDAAGIGSSRESATTVNITIKPDGNYAPVVIAKGGSYAAGIGAGRLSNFVGFIDIKGGFVAAQRGTVFTNLCDIGRGSGTASGTVTISGGSVYAASGLVTAPRNAGNTLVYPLYVPAAPGSNSVSVSNPSPAFTEKTIGKTAARFLSTGLWTEAGADQFPATRVDPATLADLLPHALSATLWLPANKYPVITVDGAGDYSAKVTAALVPYTAGGKNRLLKIVDRE